MPPKRVEWIDRIKLVEREHVAIGLGVDRLLADARRCDPPFPLDIIVRTPRNAQWRLAEGESFLREITTKGKVLYETNDARMGAQSRKRLPTRKSHRSG